MTGCAQCVCLCVPTCERTCLLRQSELMAISSLIKCANTARTRSRNKFHARTHAHAFNTQNWRPFIIVHQSSSYWLARSLAPDRSPLWIASAGNKWKKKMQINPQIAMGPSIARVVHFNTDYTFNSTATQNNFDGNRDETHSPPKRARRTDGRSTAKSADATTNTRFT